MKYRLFGVGLKGKSPVVSAQHRINCYLDRIVDEDTEQTAIIGSPGLDLFLDLGDTPVRGWIVVGDLLYLVHRSTFYEVNNSGVQTARGTISTTTGRVDMAHDGAVIVMVDGSAGNIYTIATTTLAVISDVDFPDTASTVTWQDGYFIVEDGATFQLSETGVSWDALDVASAESAPDGIVRVLADHGELSIFGDTTTEFWSNTGGADFPYQPVRGATREIGLASRFSLCQFDDALAFLGKNKLGQVQVMRLNGHIPVAISTPELDSIINRYATVSDATGYAHMHEGHPFYRLNFPSAGKSWEYDGLASTQMGTHVWCERQSGLNAERHRGEMAIDYMNKVRIADFENGKIYSVSATTYAENGNAFPFELTSKRVIKDYDPFTLNKLFLDFETGVGLATGQGSDPQVMLRVSRDGGRTFDNEMSTSLGAIGKYRARVEWHQFGMSESFVFRVRITDPVKRHLVNASLLE